MTNNPEMPEDVPYQPLTRSFVIEGFIPEIAAIKIILETLEDFDAKTQIRILDYVLSRLDLLVSRP